MSQSAALQEASYFYYTTLLSILPGYIERQMAAKSGNKSDVRLVYTLNIQVYQL